MSCPAWAGPLRDVARTLVSSGAVEVYAVLETSIGLAFAPLGQPWLIAAPGATVIRWLAHDCDVTQAVRDQMATAHDLLLIEAGLWAIAGTAVVGSATVALPIIGTVGSAAVVGAVGAIMLAAAEVAAAISEGREPRAGVTAPLTPWGRWAIEPFLWLVAAGWGAAFGEAATSTPAAKTAIRNAARRAAGEPMDEDNDPFAPMVTWPAMRDMPLSRELDGDGVSGAATYQRRYLSAARAAYADNPNVDLRPWIFTQAQSDIQYCGRRLQEAAAVVGMAPGNVQRWIIHLRAVLMMLQAWQASSLPMAAGGLNADGAWSRDTVERLLSQRAALTNLPVVVSDGNNGGDTVDNGGGGFAAAAAVVVGLILAFK